MESMTPHTFFRRQTHRQDIRSPASPVRASTLPTAQTKPPASRAMWSVFISLGRTGFAGVVEKQFQKIKL